MGSISPLPSPPSIPENPFTNYRIYTCFCSNDLLATTNMSNWIECYDPSNNSWHRVDRIPELRENHVRKGFSMASIGDSIYIIGGRLCRKAPGPDSDEIVEGDREVLSSVIRYDIRNGAWSKCEPLGTPRFDFACTVCDDKIYVAGGQCTLGIARGTSSAEVYDPALDEWKPLPNMSVLRYKSVGVTWQGKIYVVGGFAEKADLDKLPWNTIGRCSAEVYDSDNAKWELVMGMWQLDVPPNQIVAVDEKLYSSGDCLNAWKGHIEAYDGKLWNEVDGSHLETLSSPISISAANWPPIKRLYITMAPVGTHLFFLAGYRKPGELCRVVSVVHVFNTSANRDPWRSLEPMEEEGEKELCSHGCVVSLGHNYS
ncbi:Galactose oxidase/kelch repeat superfamily protein, putative [Theobroma cacao]|uniref:Galactose oxidase/kelch repeat superfamily protein, putative n=1 Tax=Theobroma cacao TaxID=3641 RepID=A0A061EAP6_THECC|nr:Galactose oxidase/kelch repeat superfamily protein, putative [Theobroma cacao]